MKIYLAGAKPFFKYLRGNKYTNKILMTYWDTKGMEMDRLEPGWDLFMDCGAYSAWTHGETIDVHEYAKFLLKYKHKINVYPNLDVKGSIEKTKENMHILESQYGLHPIPVFHVKTERWDILEEYIEKYPYIALGAIAGENISKEETQRILDNCFSRAKRSPLTKFHGFGFTVEKFLARYPFYSADSTSWLTPVKFGQTKNGSQVEAMRVKQHNVGEAIFAGVRQYVNMEKRITNLWTTRGITWED